MIEVAGFGRVPQRLAPLHNHLLHIRPGRQDVHHHGDELGQRHCSGIGGLGGAAEFRLHIGRGEFDYLR